MPTQPGASRQSRIAVIGAGISGMGAAHELARDHQVVLFEAEPRLGGHARTRMAGPRGDQPVDTGFIVFNYANYPHLAALFDKLDVPVIKSDMSFGASVDGGRVEYGLKSLPALFAQRRNALRPSFLRMCRDVMRFNARGLDLSGDSDLTVGGLLDRLGSGAWFRDYYILPLSGAIWSTPKEKILDFPAHAMMTFFKNHALLGVHGQHQWYTVEGGSQEYVSRLGHSLAQRGVALRLGCPVDAVRRTASGVEIKTDGAEWEAFDEVIFASHSDQSFRMLADPTSAERASLGNFRYQPNTVLLHSDASVMPRRRAVWSSWNYTEAADKGTEKIDLTYWMNSLQSWLEEPLFVTLNSTRQIREDLIWDEVTLHHPVYDLSALEAQRGCARINGDNNTWFCGAWMKDGFHEDGLSSAMDVVEGIRAKATARLAAQ
ncbi:NAD(P)/FAD-dependent oxidoreductase [Salibaculum sp.]|uniref:NAD(P)/FAD-dependent oxidoreductase n=1 Tax=Salibaculum sp. TaxID=2855480 RepID=UPI002B480226|nr:FAD-dependent oxidoreductase [Salibaculum sp.]HKL69040.1 FAD-dependent oxidoreductase [Salibaculum sp.]